MNTFNMTCEAVEATLADYLDETLEAWVRSSVEEHLGQCLRCAALVRDLRGIEREAAALPDLVPVRDLWPEIESRIGTPVVPFVPVIVSEPDAGDHVTPRRTEPDAVVHAAPRRIEPDGPRHAPAPRPRPVPIWLAAAAALVVLTAGTTYLLTARSVRQAGAPNVASTPTATRPAPLAPDDGLSGAPTDLDSSGSSSRDAEPADSPRRAPQSARRASTSLASRSATEAVYDKEIVMLQAIMRWRKAQLDPATAAVIDKNLKIIDAAIAQSKAALRRDPSSYMLGDQLTHALDKKVELLRTAAMLPSTT